jgi:hypothetical protein
LTFRVVLRAVAGLTFIVALAMGGYGLALDNGPVMVFAGLVMAFAVLCVGYLRADR